MTFKYPDSNVVLFGAGASAFGSGVRPKNPPLGDKLFSELDKLFPEFWGNISLGVQDRFHSNFEEAMGYIWDTYPNAVQPPVQGIPSPYDLMRILAIFFLQFEPDGTRSDLYLKFTSLMFKAQKLDKVRIVTLNYENLIEYALAAIGQPFRVLRPHGAVHWWVQRPTLKTDNGRALGAGLNIIGKVKNIDRRTVRKRMTEEGKYPSMAMYMPSKRTQVGQRHLISHQIRFKSAVMTANKVAIIGARPNPADEHIWGVLAQVPGTLYYVGDQGPFDEWSNEYRPSSESIWLGSTFEESISDLVDEL